MSYADCHPDRPNQGRGLCSACYSRAWRSGTLDQYKHRNYVGQGRPATCLAVLEDVLWVWDCTCRCHTTATSRTVHGSGRACRCGGLPAIAKRLGVSTAALAKALERARARREMSA